MAAQQRQAPRPPTVNDGALQQQLQALQAVMQQSQQTAMQQAIRAAGGNPQASGMVGGAGAAQKAACIVDPWVPSFDVHAVMASQRCLCAVRFAIKHLYLLVTGLLSLADVLARSSVVL